MSTDGLAIVYLVVLLAIGDLGVHRVTDLVGKLQREVSLDVDPVTDIKTAVEEEVSQLDFFALLEDNFVGWDRDRLQAIEDFIKELLKREAVPGEVVIPSKRKHVLDHQKHSKDLSKVKKQEVAQKFVLLLIIELYYQI